MAKARAYTIGKIPADTTFRGQAKLIMDVLDAEIPRTTASVANEIKDKLVTRQDPERVVAFYMSVWKKKGIVKLHEIDVPTEEAAVTNAVDEAPANVHEEVGPIDADKHEEIKMEVAVETAAQQLPDLRGRKLSEAVIEVLKLKGSLSAPGITEFLNANGYDFQLNQVNSALQNLQRKETVVRENDAFTLA